jgi:hypothetical protein
VTTRMNTIRRTRRRARSLTSRHSLFVVSLSSFSRARPMKRFLRVSRRDEKERSSDQPIDRSLRQDRSRKIKIPAPAWLRGFFSKRKNPLRHRLIRTGIWRGVNRSASRYGENGESFSSHAPAFSPPIRDIRRSIACENISRGGENFADSRSRVHRGSLGSECAGRATPLGARRGRDRAKATGAQAETSGPCPSTGAARDSAGGACGCAKRTRITAFARHRPSRRRFERTARPGRKRALASRATARVSRRFRGGTFVTVRRR